MLTREQLRVARTKFVHRWHAAQTIGERLANDAVGERFEHVNHATTYQDSALPIWLPQGWQPYGGKMSTKPWVRFRGTRVRLPYRRPGGKPK